MVVDTKGGLCGVDYFTLGGFLINYVFRYVMMLSMAQLKLLNCITCYSDRSKVAVSDDEKAMRSKRIARAQLIEMLFLPVVFVLWLVSLVAFYPVFFLGAFFRALYRRAVVGRPSDFFKTDMQGPFTSNPDYPCQFVFDKPFDQMKLTQLYKELCTEAKLPTELVSIDFPDVPINDFPATSGFGSDYYVSGGPDSKQIGPDDNGFSVRMGELNQSKVAILLRCHNNAPGKPTVWNCYLPGGAWDGSSCFNFAKELIHRYYGGTPNPIFAAETLVLRPDAAAKIDANSSFGAFLCRMPGSVLANMSDFLWHFYRVQPLLGGPGLLPRMNVLNFDEPTSTLIAEGMRAKGVSPFAGFVWASVEAFQKVKGFYPYSVIQLASTQSRLYDPVIKQRNLVGDWLIGPVRRLRALTAKTGEFTLIDSEKMYGDLIAELGHGTDCGSLDGEVAKAIEAKHYGILNHGAAVFEFFPFYPDTTRILDSLFLNNYGMRYIHPDAGFVSYNWGCPGGVALNTMCINGKTCSMFGTGVHSTDECDAIRDEAEQLILSFVQGGSPSTLM